jgi:hypothetical protein
MTTQQVVKGFLRGGVAAHFFSADFDMPAMAAQMDANQPGTGRVAIGADAFHGKPSECVVENSHSGTWLSILSPPWQTAASCLHLSPRLPAGAKLAGFFEVTA